MTCMRSINRYGIRVGEVKLYIGTTHKATKHYIKFINAQWIKDYLNRNNIVEHNILRHFNLDDALLRSNDCEFFTRRLISEGLCFKREVPPTVFNLDLLADTISNIQPLGIPLNCRSNINLKNIKSCDNMFYHVGKAIEHIHNTICEDRGLWGG